MDPKISTGAYMTPVDILAVSYMHHRDDSGTPQVSFLTPVGRFSDTHRCQKCTTPTKATRYGFFDDSPALRVGSWRLT